MRSARGVGHTFRHTTKLKWRKKKTVAPVAASSQGGTLALLPCPEMVKRTRKVQPPFSRAMGGEPSDFLGHQCQRINGFQRLS